MVRIHDKHVGLMSIYYINPMIYEYSCICVL
nr:MAG TPA: hypothetical protein [Bacteriophage sp.]